MTRNSSAPPRLDPFTGTTPRDPTAAPAHDWNERISADCYRPNAELGNLTGLLAKIKPAVTATVYTGERSSKNYAFVDAVARKNVELTIADIRKDSPVLAGMESSGTIKIAGAMYNLATGVIDFF